VKQKSFCFSRKATLSGASARAYAADGLVIETTSGGSI
jgi:hypothetical protein